MGRQSVQTPAVGLYVKQHTTFCPLFFEGGTAGDAPAVEAPGGVTDRTGDGFIFLCDGFFSVVVAVSTLASVGPAAVFCVRFFAEPVLFLLSWHVRLDAPVGC